MRFSHPAFFAICPALLLLTSPAAAERSAEKNGCMRIVSRDEALALAVRSLPPGDLQVRLSGLQSLPEDSVWQLLGGEPADPISHEEIVALLARLTTTGLFATIVATAGAEGLEIELTENPGVRSVRVRGLSEFRSEDVLDRLLETPSSWDINRSRPVMKEADPTKRPRSPPRRHPARDKLAHGPASCPEALPSRDFFARVEDGETKPGILWKGLRGALDRVADYLGGRGYPLARLEGSLSPSGILQIDVDEGHLSAVEVRGIDAGLAREVVAELGFVRGDVFSSGELDSGLDRVERRWPFLRADRRSNRRTSAPSLRIEPLPDGGAEFHTEAQARAEESDVEEDEEPPRSHRSNRHRAKTGSWYGFEGDKLLVYLRAERTKGDVQWVEILRHTPVTGFAPGLAATATFYDPKDRVHLLLDGAVNFNTRRPSREEPGGTFLERLSAQERVDWLLGARLRIPGLAVAELGGQIHALTDTSDRWRISRVDSYVYSALINRADREYYRRSGYAAILTTHFFETLTLGAEYRRDQYDPLPAPPGVWTIFNKDDPRYGSAPVDRGEIGSVVLRAEYRSEKIPLHKVGSMWRNSETSLLPQEPGLVGVRSLNTVEIADRSLGGIFDFTKVLSDNFLVLETGTWSTLTLRARAAFGNGLPLQKQEGLGGWTALRGYDFKEFRGDASLLGTLQYEGKHLGVFFDAGSVRQTGTFLDPRTSAGLSFSFAEGSTRMEAAWRLDSRAKIQPDFRVLFSVPL